MTHTRSATERRFAVWRSLLPALALAFVASIAAAAPPVQPLGRVAGLFTVLDADVHLPEQVTLRALEPLIPYPGPRLRQRSFSCPIDWRQGRGVWSCELPAATYDLAVGAPAFVPQLREGVEVRPGETVDVGSFALEKGSSLVGWIVSDDRTLDAERCLVRVLPSAAPPGADPQRPQVPVYLGDPRLLERRVEPDGTFRIGNVRPGTWAVEVRCPGYATAQLTGVTVRAGRDEQVRPAIALQRRLNVEITLVPSTPDSFPWWSVTMWRVGNLAAQSGARTLRWDRKVVDRESGRVVFPGVAPGRFEIQVKTLDNAIVESEVVSIREPEEARITIVPPPRRPVTIDGTVTKGGAPVSASLSLTGPAGRMRSLRSDDRGRFSGELPVPGRWRVESAEGGEIALLDIPRRRRVAVTLAIPDTRLVGKVLDAAGSPAAYARVTALARGALHTTTADEDGRFELQALPPGRAAVFAEREILGSGEAPQASPIADLEISAERSSGPVALRLGGPQVLRGRIAGGPDRTGSVVAFQPQGGPPRPIAMGPDGRFSVALAAGTEGGTLVVWAADSTLTAYAISTRRGDVDVVPARESGALELDLPCPVGDLELAREVLEISQNGARFAYSQDLGAKRIGGWRIASADDDRARRTVVLPKVAPGLYKVCLGPAGPDGLIDRSADAASRVVCDGGLVEPGGELQLSVK